VDHGAHLLHPLLVALPHPVVLFEAVVRVEESQRIVLPVLVESRKDGVGGQSGGCLVEVWSKGFGRREVDSDFGFPFEVFELKEILLFIDLLFLASSGVFSHWCNLKL
jgi:hypothetical protein